MKRVMVFLAVAVSLLLSTSTFSCTPMGGKEGATRLVLGTGVEGTYGYVYGVGLARVINKHLDDIYVDVVAREGYTTINKIVCEGKGEIDLTTISAGTLVELYEGLADFKGVKLDWAPQFSFVHSGQVGFWLTNRNDIKSVKDFAGKKVYPGAPGSSVRQLNMLYLQGLGLWDKIVERQLASPMDAADALKMGTIDFVPGYTAGTELVDFVANIDAMVRNLKIVPLTDEEIAKECAASPGRAAVSALAKDLFTQDVGVELVKGAGAPYSCGIGTHVSPDIAYKLVKCWWENSDELIEYVPNMKGLTQYKKDWLIPTCDMLAQHKIPIHPGVARFYKEIGVWKSNWIEGQYKPLPTK